MKIAIASDHGGYSHKAPLIAHLEEQGVEVIDFGPATEDRVDYPDYAVSVAQAVATGAADFGVLICGTGLGMSIAANKVKGIRAAAVQNEDFTRLSREHNNANVICLSGRFVDLETNKRLLDIFITTAFSGGRHADRLEQVMQLD